MERKESEMLIDELKFDEHNFNSHTREGMKLLEKSVREHKFGRSILVDKDNNIIAGNGVVETAKKLGRRKIKVIETTGDEIVVVKRTDVDINTKQGREMALADNTTSAVDLCWNKDEIEKAKEKWDVIPEAWGLNDNREEIASKDSAYEQKIVTPIYEITGDVPEVSTIVDARKVKSLLYDIDKSSAPKNVKEMLKICAYRHAVIDFSKMAEFYAHANKQIQTLMEDSGLVIIDYDKAIANGFVEVVKDIKDMIYED